MSVHTRVGMQWLMPVTYSEAQNKVKYSYPQLGAKKTRIQIHKTFLNLPCGVVFSNLS